MIVFPAIDLFSGKAVRLVNGDYNRMTIYDRDPLHTAFCFQTSGAEYLHVVDLEGALEGKTPNFETIRSILENTDLKVQVGGGIRDRDTVEKYLNAGVYRVILGTVAVTKPVLLTQMIKDYGERIAVGVDIRNGKVATNGWKQLSKYPFMGFINKIAGYNVPAIICTDISKDGMLAGFNSLLYKAIIDTFPGEFIASGGISSVEDIQQLKELNVQGVILGKALYEKKLRLEDALAAAKGE